MSNESTYHLDETQLTDSDPLVGVRDLATYFDDSYFSTPVKAVDGVNFDIVAGETLALVGESGCGKSTLARTLLGFEEPTRGSITYDGRDVADLAGRERRRWQRDAQMVFQDPNESLNDRMAVGKIIREPLDAHEVGTPDARDARVDDLLERVGLPGDVYTSYPHQLSGGQKQRVGIARALALEPDFLVLDEPTSALDVSVQARIVNLLTDLQEDLQLTYLFIAHDLSVVRHVADRVAVMYLGNLVEVGPTERVFENPTHPYTMSLLAAIPGSTSPWTGPDVELGGAPPSPRDPPAGCPFATRCPTKIRPEEWRDLSDDEWALLDNLRAVLRERARDDSLTARVRVKLGIGSRRESLEEVAGTLDALPDAAYDVAVDVLDLARQDRNEAAEAYLIDAFGSLCDREHPSHERIDGRDTACLRHRDEYDNPRDAI